MAVHAREVELLLDPDRYHALEQVARHTNRSVTAVVKDAIDRYLAGPDGEERDVDPLTPENAPGA